MRSLLTFLVLLVSLAPPAVAQDTRPPEYTLDAIRNDLAARHGLLLDVREESEWQAGHLRDARLVPLSELQDAAELEKIIATLPKDKRLYLHCRSGRRCKSAAAILNAKGFKAIAVAEGYQQLVEAGFAPETSVKPGINDEFTKPDMSLAQMQERFEGESREVFAHREAIVKLLELEPGQNVIDLGAGTGFFAAMFAEQVSPGGEVLAVDIAPKFIEHIRSLAQDRNLSNLTAVLSDGANFEAPANWADAVFVCDVYHHLEYPHRTMAVVERSLKPGGRLVVIDFKRVEGQSRPWVLEHVRAGMEVFRSEIEAAGLAFVSVDEGLLDENYVMVFEKPAQ